jgi:hypothetical protein
MMRGHEAVTMPERINRVAKLIGIVAMVVVAAGIIALILR